MGPVKLLIKSNRPFSRCVITFINIKYNNITGVEMISSHFQAASAMACTISCRKMPLTYVCSCEQPTL